MKFSENEYVDASQQKKIQQKKIQLIYFVAFLAKKLSKLIKKIKKIVKSINITIT